MYLLQAHTFSLDICPLALSSPAWLYYVRRQLLQVCLLCTNYDAPVRPIFRSTSRFCFSNDNFSRQFFEQITITSNYPSFTRTGLCISSTFTKSYFNLSVDGVVSYTTLTLSCMCFQIDF